MVWNIWREIIHKQIYRGYSHQTQSQLCVFRFRFAFSWIQNAINRRRVAVWWYDPATVTINDLDGVKFHCFGCLIWFDFGKIPFLSFIHSFYTFYIFYLQWNCCERSRRRQNLYIHFWIWFELNIQSIQGFGLGWSWIVSIAHKIVYVSCEW